MPLAIARAAALAPWLAGQPSPLKNRIVHVPPWSARPTARGRRLRRGRLAAGLRGALRARHCRRHEV